MACYFQCEYDPRSKGPLNKFYDKDEFQEFGSKMILNPQDQENEVEFNDDNTHLFKLAAKDMID